MATYFILFIRGKLVDRLRYFILFIRGKLVDRLRNYVVEKIVVYTVAPIRDYFVNPIRDYWFSHIGRTVGYLLSYNTNMEVFRNGVEKLGIIRAKVRGRVDDAVRQGKDILPKVHEWLTSVKEITKEDSRNLFDDNNYKLQVNLKLRYQRSKKTEERAAVVDERIRQGSSFDRISTCAEMFESRRSNLRRKKRQALREVGITVTLGLSHRVTELICPSPKNEEE